MSSKINNPLARLIKSLDGPIVIIGSSGFVGANLFHLIKSFRDDVFACIHKNKGWRLDNVASKYLVSLDLKDETTIRTMVKKIKPKVIFNCSSFGAYSFETDQSLIYDTNFIAITKLVSILEESSFSSLVHAGSSSEYGTNSNAPKENDLCIPNSHYSVSKLAATNYLQYMGKCQGFPCITLRLYSVYGPLEDTSRLIPKLVTSALSNGFPSLVDPKISRDFIYISDVCNAFIKAALEIKPEYFGETYNIGTGIKTTIKDLALTTKETFKVTENPSFGSMAKRNWDLSNWYANPKKAEYQLNWKAEISLNEGLEKTSKWINTMTEKKQIDTTKRVTNATT